jgi:hypothetical protein
MSAIETPDWSEDNGIKFKELFRDKQLSWNSNQECYKIRGHFQENSVFESRFMVIKAEEL